MHCSQCGTDIGNETVCRTCGQAVVLLTSGPAPYPGSDSTGNVNSTTVPRFRTINDPVLGLPLTTWWRRVGATIIDGLIVAAVSFIVSALSSSLTVRYVVAGIFGLLYQVILTSSKSGQTLGNRAVGTSVRLASTGNQITPGVGLVRWAVHQLPYTIAYLAVLPKLNKLLPYFRTFKHPGQIPTTFPTWVLNDLSTVGRYLLPVMIYSLINYLWPLWNPRRRTIHDLAAGTVVLAAP